MWRRSHNVNIIAIESKSERYYEAEGSNPVPCFSRIVVVQENIGDGIPYRNAIQQRRPSKAPALATAAPAAALLSLSKSDDFHSPVFQHLDQLVQRTTVYQIYTYMSLILSSTRRKETKRSASSNSSLCVGRTSTRGCFYSL